MTNPESFPRTPANQHSPPKVSSHPKRKPSIQPQQSSGWGWPRFVSVEVDIVEKRRQRRNEAMPVNATAELSRPEQGARNQSFQKAHDQIPHSQPQNEAQRKNPEVSSRTAPLVSGEHNNAYHSLPTSAAERQSDRNAHDQMSATQPQTEAHRKQSDDSNQTAALVSEGHDKADNADLTPAAERQSNKYPGVEEHTSEHKDDTDARTDTQVLADASQTPLPPEKEIVTAEDPSAECQSNWSARAEGKTMDQKNDTNARPNMQGVAEASQTPLAAEKEETAAEDPSAEYQSYGNDPNTHPNSQVLADARKTSLPPEKDNVAAEGPSAGTADKYELTGAEKAHPHRNAEQSSFYEGSGGSTQDERFSGSAVDPLSKVNTMTPGAFPDDDGESVYSDSPLNDKVAQEPVSATNDVRDESSVDKEESLEQSRGTSQEHPVSKSATEPKRRSFSPGPAESSESSGAELSQERDSDPRTNEEGESQPIQTPSQTLPAGEVRKSVESLPKKLPRQSITASSSPGKADTDKPSASSERPWVPIRNNASGETVESPETTAPHETVNDSTQSPTVPKRSSSNEDVTEHAKPNNPIVTSSAAVAQTVDRRASEVPVYQVQQTKGDNQEATSDPLAGSPGVTGVSTAGQQVDKDHSLPEDKDDNRETMSNPLADSPDVTGFSKAGEPIDKNRSLPEDKDDNQDSTSEPLADSPDVTGVSKAGQQVDTRPSLPGGKDDNQEATSDPLADGPDVRGVSKAGQQVDKNDQLLQDKDDNQKATLEPLFENRFVARFSKAGQQVDNKPWLPEDRGGDEEAGQPNESQPPELKRSETQAVDIMKRISVSRSINAHNRDDDEEAVRSVSQPPELKRSEIKPVDIMNRISVPSSIYARDNDSDEEVGQQSERQTPELKRSETKPVDIMDRINVPPSIYGRDNGGGEEAGEPIERQTPELKRCETKPVDIMDRVSVPPSMNSRRGSKAPKKVTLPPPKIFVQSPSEATPLDDELTEPHPTPAGHLHNDEYRITSRNGSIVSVQHTVNSAAEKLSSPRVKKRKLYLRKARNLAARRIFLNAALGRKMGGRTKDKLQRLARGEEVPSTPVSTQPHAAESPPLRKRSSVIRKVRNVASRQSLLDAALGRQVGRETKPVLRRMAKGENIVVEEA